MNFNFGKKLVLKLTNLNPSQSILEENYIVVQRSWENPGAARNNLENNVMKLRVKLS